MAIELSADTYDWKGQEQATKGMIRAVRDITNACQDAPKIELGEEDPRPPLDPDDAPPLDPEEVMDAKESGGWSDWQECWARIVKTHRQHLNGPEQLKSSFLDEEHSTDPGVRLTITTGANDHHYKLITKYLPSGTIEVTALRMDLWSQTASMVYVFHNSDIENLTDARWERYLDEMEYHYRHRREAELLAEETLFSQREAEVLLLEREGWTDKYISRITDISQSTISTYRQRRSEKRTQAEESKCEAERTIEVLMDAEDLPTSRCTRLPPDIGMATYEQYSMTALYRFVWLPEEYDASSLVSGVPVATFYAVDGAMENVVLLVIERPGGEDEYYHLTPREGDAEIEQFRESASEQGRWVNADEVALTP